MGIVLSLEEKKIIDNFCSLSDMHVTDDRFNDSKIRESLIQTMTINIIASYLGSSPNNYKKAVELYKEGEDHIVLFAVGLATASLIGYLQSANNDVDVDEFPEFGYVGLIESIQGAILLNMGIIEDFENIEDLLCNGLNVEIRDIDAESYFSSELFRDDIEVLNQSLTADIDDGYNVEIKNALKSDGDICGAMDKYMKDLKAVYNLAFREGFGTKPYYGVLFDKSSFYTIENNSQGKDSFTATKISNGRLTLAKLADRLYRRASKEVSFSTKRQFDYDEIFASSLPVYYPLKILEYTMGRESTLNITTNRYKASAYSTSWESYAENYVFPNLQEVLIRGYYKAFEKVLKSKRKIKADFVSQDFMLTVGNYTDFLNEYLTVEVYTSIEKYISRLVDSMKCLYILTSYPYLANQIVGINIRLSAKIGSTNFTDESSMQVELFRDLIATNKNEDFNSVINITDGRTSDSGNKISVNIYEYQFNANPLIAKAEPLFGYTVQQLNQKKGVGCNWGNILIGESREGKELYASANSDVSLQNNFIHNIYAGSRSGKGVMTMNILANAIVAGKPVFYLDRKPDMANMLYGLSGGKQFIVNGGDYSPSYDLGGYFNETSGEALKTWRVSKSWLESNPKILDLFNVASADYYSVLADIVYLRAFMFTLGICYIRGKLSGSSLRDEVFNGNNGIVVVVDELTNFQGSIASLLASLEESNKFTNKALNIGSVEEVLKKKKEIENKIEVANLKKAEAKKDSAILTQENEIAKLQGELNNLFDEQAIYASTFFNKIVTSYNLLMNSKNALFKNNESNYSDIFVLGQNLERGYYCSSLTSANKGTLSPIFFPLKSDRSGYYSSYNGADIIRSFLEEFDEKDWFLGRNPAYKYGGCEEDTSISDYLNDSNWDYVGTHSCEQIRGIDKSASFKHTLFKSYLVLNNNLENDPPKNRGENEEYQYVAQCADRVDSIANCELWDTVRLKHIRKCDRDKVTPDNKLYNHLEEGIGFRGLIKETLLTTKEGKDEVNNLDDYIVKSLAKSGDIADFVASKMGYPDGWQSLIFDLSPKGLFSFEDMLNAVAYPEKYTLESRFPLYAQLGLLDSIAGNSIQGISGVETPESSMPTKTILERFSNESFESSEPQVTNDEIDNMFRNGNENEYVEPTPNIAINRYADVFYGDENNFDKSNQGYFEDDINNESYSEGNNKGNNDGYNDGYTKGYDDACRSFANFYIDTSGLSFPNRQEAFDFIYNYLKSKEA